MIEKTEEEVMGNFIVLNSPFVHSGNDVNKMFLYTSVALVVPAVYGIIFLALKRCF